ncbi:hypothetical protein LG634_09255 [Streptomyces bambusae]|uniref:hypothetical protein n=1 Tax=Streptomyces bambusae TaxID=1550616 RepID=UPI001CFE3543|nr:hypothetical protein [Streptomyces bambusae]MCB5165013.1 hypothetical protein [Streptomyces bambusae]
MLTFARSRARSRRAVRLLGPVLLAALLAPVAPVGNALAAAPPAATAPTAAVAPSPESKAGPKAAPKPAPKPAPMADAERRRAEADAAAERAAADGEECRPLALAPLGDPGDAVGTATVPPKGTACFTVTVTKPGMHRLLASDQYAYPSLAAGETQVECGPQGHQNSWCDLAAGTYTLSVYNTHWEPVENRVSLVPLMPGPVCPPLAGTGYDVAPTRASAPSNVAVVCHAFTAAPGQRITADFTRDAYGDSHHWITDATGKRICPVRDENGGTSCVLPAGGGTDYRVLASVSRQDGGFPAGYELKVRRLSDPEGCVPVGLTAYGSAPAKAAPQTGCRTFTAPATGRYSADAVNAQGEVSGIGVFRTDGSTVCAAGQDCALTAGTRYTLLTDGAVRILDRTATAGCGTGLVLAGDHRGTFAAPGEVDCVKLPLPKGAHVAVLSDRVGEIALVDAKGTAFCSEGMTDGTCVLGGTAPYRALVSQRDPSEKESTYGFVVHRTDGPSACRTFLPGDFSGKPVRMSVKNGADAFGDCLSVPADGHSARELFQIQRVSGEAGAEVSVLDATGKQICAIRSYYGTFSSCSLTPGVAHTVLVQGRNVPAEFALTRLDVTATARGCVPTPAVAVGGPSTGGVPAAPGTFLCHQVTTASAKDTLHLNVRDALESARVMAFRADGQVVCDYFSPGCAASGATRYQVLVQVPADKAAAPSYRLDALRIGTPTGPAPECVKVPNVSYGFGPLTATLSEKKSAVCAALPSADGDLFALKFTPGGTFEQSPTPWLYDRSGLKNGCYGSTSSQGQNYKCSLPGSFPKAARPSTLVIGLPEKPAAASTAVKVDAVCVGSVCGTDERTVGTVSPGTVGQGKINMSVTGSALREDAVVEVRGEGFSARSRTVSVAPDRRSMTVALDLTKAPLGALSVYVNAHGMSYMKGSVTVVAPIRSTAAPTVRGAAVVGSTVTATTGSWSPAADSYAYQWRADGTAIAGATASSYAVPAALLGKKLSVVVTARKAGHPAVPARSSGVVVKGAAPKATKAPTISGTAKVGSVLTAKPGTWTPAAASYTYQWYANGQAVSGATRTTFKPASAQLGKRITVTVTAHRPGHASGTATSAATAKVTR